MKKLGYMICPDCKKECAENDFIMQQESCFRCTYAKKKLVQNQPVKKKCLCRMCEKELIFQEQSTKRQRNVYCSEKCAKKGQRVLNDSHWTRTIKINMPLDPRFSSRVK